MIEKAIGYAAAAGVWSFAIATAPAMWAGVAVGTVIVAPAMRATLDQLDDLAEVTPDERRATVPA